MKPSGMRVLSVGRDSILDGPAAGLSFDIDALDPAFVPGTGTGTPVADGLSPEECGQALDALGGLNTVASAAFVEYNLALDPSGATAQLTLALIERLLSKATAP